MSSSEGESPKTKKIKTEEESLKVNNEGDHYFEISGKRRVTLRKWQKSLLIDLREYYDAADGEPKPGKKGISLSVEQWKALKQHIPAIDKLIEEASTKK